MTDAPWLSIGELAERTGVSVATLRAWEARHGFPTPVRLPSGHRRYGRDDVARVLEVVRRRDQGLRLDAVVAQIAQAAAAPDGSVFATLRREHPHLAVERLHKSTLTALSWAIEDEFCARATRARIFGAFQRPEHYLPSQRRWEELARVASAAFVYAAFDDLSAGANPTAEPWSGGVVPVSLAPDSPMHREWAVVCDSDELPVVLSAWELPGQDGVPDDRRLFEAVWTVEPGPVRRAARVCAEVAAAAEPDRAAPVLYALADDPVRTTPDLAALATMFTRVLRYVDRRGSLADRL